MLLFGRFLNSVHRLPYSGMSIPSFQKSAEKSSIFSAKASFERSLIYFGRKTRQAGNAPALIHSAMMKAWMGGGVDFDVRKKRT